MTWLWFTEGLENQLSGVPRGLTFCLLRARNDFSFRMISGLLFKANIVCKHTR